MEQEVIADIVRRVKKMGRYTETAELMAKSMTEQGYSASRIQAEVMKCLRADKEYQKAVAENTKAYKQEIQDIIDETLKKAEEAGEMLIEEAGNMAWNNDLSMWGQHGVDLKKPNTMSQLIAAFKIQTVGELRNLTQSMGFKNTALGKTGVLQAYQREMDLATLKIATGVFSYDVAVNDCIKRLAASGLRSIDYASGRSYQLDTAARMCVRTGTSQLAGRVTEMNLKNTGHDLVITSQHMGSRPEHVPIQNKVFSYSGKNKKYPDFQAPIGRGGAGYGMADGIKGPNCNHDFYPYWEGDYIPPDAEPNEGYYKNTQKQRAMERGIRATKREIEAQRAIGGDITELKAKLKKQNNEYYAFSKKAGIRAKDNRLRVQAGSSDLKKTNAWKRQKKSTEYSDLKSADKRIYVGGENKIFDGKSAIEKSNIAKGIVAKYTDRECKWNGQAEIVHGMKANGKFFKDGHIEYAEHAGNRTYIHEMLHAYSAPYIPKEKRSSLKVIEEASVELLAREICNEKQIPYYYVNNKNVDALLRINEIMSIEENSSKYAQLVYNISPGNRLTWLSGKIERYIKKNAEYEKELNLLLERLKGNV